jgi:RNA polymerase sigma-70 factor (ECF subfamily)
MMPVGKRVCGALREIRPARRGTFSHRWASILAEQVVVDDFQLIDDALAGRPSAFGDLVLRYQDRLYNTLVHVTGSVEDARDLVQEAFVQALVKLNSFQRNSAFYTWLYRIALNLAISRRRRRKPTVSVDEIRHVSGEEPVGRDDAPADRIEREERAGQVQAALARLTEEHRSVLVLREIDGYCYEEIAEMLDVPVGTVRSRLHRARLMLRDELKDVLQEDCR